LQWPGRLQLVTRPGGQQILLDGAHNADGAVALRAAFEEKFPGTRPALILGVLADKDWAVMCALLAPLAGRIWCVPVSSERTADPSQLRAACARANPAAEVRLSPNLSAALTETEPEPLVVIAGSLYLIGETLEHLKLVTTVAVSERGLNEWGSGTAERAN
jgi:dihydrofolate synthase/folylpolyglutamate synthase